MDKTLKTLHLRLDSTSKSLTKNAIGQIIVKILFLAEKQLSDIEICEQVNKVLNVKMSNERIFESINKLSAEKEIKEKKKIYYLSASKKRKISQLYTDAKKRLNRIIDNYFKPFETKEQEIKKWISDSTILFFKEYSTDWISDICYKSSNQIEKQKTNILELINNRTLNNRVLEKGERKELCKKFINFLTTNEPDVNSHLWEYGTSSFASNLINSSLGIDPMSLKAFKDSICILDTNVLMNIGLEASKHHKAFKKLDIIFSKLNIQPGYLFITQEEYKRTVGNKRDEILKSVEKFPFDVIEETDDDYIQSAIIRQCRNTKDFEQFFSQVITPPEFVDENHKIELFDSDKELEDKINSDKNNEQKQIELNTIFRNITGHDKRKLPLIHDVGLISGNEYLRQNEKCFIISQEISINEYAKQKPSKQQLPFALRLETLISMLAIDNGGTDINPNDYSNLFANIVRLNLIPDKDTFKIADLSKLLETEQQISQLPKEEIIEIAKDVHRNRSIGLSDEKVSLELTRKFQGAKLKIVDDLYETKMKLSQTEIERKRREEEANVFKAALRKRIKREEEIKVEKADRRNALEFFFALPIGVTLLTLVAIYYSESPINVSSRLNSYLMGLLSNLGFWLLTSFFFTKPRLAKNKFVKQNLIDDKVEERLNKELKNVIQKNTLYK